MPPTKSKRKPKYYTQLSDFSAGMKVDNRVVGECAVIEVRKEKEPITLSSTGLPCKYSCRGWVTVEYVGCHFDGRPDAIYQRCDPIIGISETDDPDILEFDLFFREIGFADHPWPKTVNNIENVNQDDEENNIQI